MIKKLLAIMLAVTVLLGCVACGPQGEAVDATRTQIYVSHFAGGFGTKWMDEIEKDFEEMYRNVSFEEGKTGVQIIATNHKDLGSNLSGQLLTNKNYVFILEDVPYNEIVNGNELLDITDVVNGTFDINTAMGDETIPDITDKDIIGKMTDVQQSALKVNNKYYGIPHYEGYYGFSYDADLFNENDWFMTADGNFTSEEKAAAQNIDLSAGPDGVSGTYDDGLPATYEEFYTLCEIMEGEGVIPFIWSGNYQFYISNALNQMVADYHGKDIEQLSYSFDGTTTEWVDIDDPDSWTEDDNGNVIPLTKSKEITPRNGYDIFAQAGYFYAMDFLSKIVYTDGWLFDDSFTDSFSHKDAQNKFLLSSKANNSTPIAMLAEGIWWQNEASAMFSTMSYTYPGSSAMERDIRFMPMPKANASKIGKTTLLESQNAFMMVKANMPTEYVNLVKLFLQYMNQESKLQQFTTISGTPKALKYELTDAQYAELTPFTKSIMEMKENADVVYQLSPNSFYANNKSEFKRYTVLGKGDYAYPSTAMHNFRISSKDYFVNHIAKTWRTSWEATFGDDLALLG